MRNVVLLLLFLLSSLTLQAAEVKSPNGNIVLNFDVEQGRPVYSMTYKGKDVVRPSHLGLELAKDKHASASDETDLMDRFRLVNVKTSEFDETWQPVWGETRSIRNHYNEAAFTLEQHTNIPVYKGGGTAPGTSLEDRTRRIIIRFRVYDDGIGFRYEFPQQRELNYFVIKEVCHGRRPHRLVAARRLRHSGAGDATD